MSFTNLINLNLQTVDYTLLYSDDVVEFNISTGKAATLPTAAGFAGKRFTIKNLDTSTAATILTVNTTSAQTIDGRASGSFKLSPGDFIQVVSDGTNWKTVVYQETIAAIYNNASNAGSAINTSTGDTILFTVKEVDTHSAFSSGTWTCPAPGVYDIRASVVGTTTANTASIDTRIFKNGSNIRGTAMFAPATVGRTLNALIGGRLRLVTGDTILINAVAGFGGINYGASNPQYYFLEITKVGN